MIIFLLMLLTSCETTYEPVYYDPTPVYEVFESVEETMHEEQVVLRSTPIMYWYSWKPLLELDWSLYKPVPEEVSEETPVIEPVEIEEPTVYDNELVTYAILIVFILIVGTLSVITTERKRRKEQ